MVTILYSSDGVGGECSECGATCGAIDRSMITALMTYQIPVHCYGCKQIIETIETDGDDNARLVQSETV